MERKRAREQEIALIKELSQGRDLAELLKIHLENLASPELCDPVIRNIISVYDKAISILNFDNLVGVINPEASDQSLQDVYKKRKTVSRWTKQVRVSSETGQCHSNDGYSWRKYGQKVILGAKFPRSYYRCTHRHVQGCLATKQVQRSDEDHSLFLISYSGKHSCVSTSTQPNHISKLETKIPNQYKNQFQNPSPFKDLRGFDLGPVKTEEIGSQVMKTPSFSFPSMPLDTENFGTYVFPESLEENSFLGDFKCEIGEFGLTDQCFQISDSDINHEIISAQASTTNSPIGNSNFSFDQVEFISDLPFDTSELFS